MKRLLRVFLLALLMVGAHAQASVPTGTQYQLVMTAGYPGQWKDTPADACISGAAAQNGNPAGVVLYSFVSVQGGSCVLSSVRKDTGASAGTGTSYAYGTRTGVCFANSTLVGGSCKCDAGAFENATHTACVVPVPESLEQFCLSHAATKNTFKQSGTIGISSSLPAASCYKPDPAFPGVDAPRGCQMTMGDVIAAPRSDGLLKDWSGTGVMTGAVCEDASATDAAPKSKDDPCPGGFPGTVNGVTKCVAAEPDKGIEGAKTSSSTAANGTKTDVKEVTKCDGDKCTTTTTSTSTTSGGTVTSGTTSVTGSLSDKCAKDPKNDVCKKTQGGSGSAVSDMSCDINPSAVGCGGDGAAIGDLYAKKDKTVAQALTKAKDALQSSPLGSSVSGFFNVSSGGSCPQTSANIPFLNKTIVIDAWCTNFAANMFGIVRAVLLMLATWMAFRIAIDN